MVPFFKSKGNFPMSSISAHGGNQVDGLHERLFSLNIGFATAYKLFANESSSRIGMHARRTFETFLSPFEHAQVCCAVIGPHANEEPAPAEPDRTKGCFCSINVGYGKYVLGNDIMYRDLYRAGFH